MDPLDIFRQSWQAEIFGEKSRPMISCQPTGDLCHVGSKSNSKRLCDDECDSTTPSISLSIPPPIGNSSFTIGVKTFAVTKAPIPPTPAVEPSTKKCKTRSTLLDLLIHDLDEATAVPFFNLSLPREIALKIFDYLSIKDLYACLQVCRAWHLLSSDNLLWLNLYKRLQLERSKILLTDDWKENVKNAILFEQQLVKNFRNHQCRTTKLTYRLGVVLTCAENDESTIIAGYSTGIIRTWSIPSILNVDPACEDAEQFDTPDIIYESIDHDEDVILSPVKSVGLLKNDLFAIHDNGLVEVWKRDVSDKPRFTQNLFTYSIEQIQHAESFLCASNRTNFFVWNFDQIDADPQFQHLNFFEEFNDDLLSFCMSTSHSVPIALLAGRKTLWCKSLSNFEHRAAFYSILRSDYVRKIPMDIHHDEPIAVVGLGGQIKLFDLQQGRCEVLNNEYNSLPSNVHLIRAKQCPNHEFLVAYDNYQISVFDRRQKFGAIQHFYGHHAPITTLQMDSWKISSTDTYGFVRLWDRRMHPQSLWQINPQVHPVSHCSFDQQTLICALTPLCKHPDMLEYQIHSDPISGHIYVCNFNCDISTQLDEDLQICTSTYDAPKASNRRIALYTPYDSIV